MGISLGIGIGIPKAFGGSGLTPFQKFGSNLLQWQNTKRSTITLDVGTNIESISDLSGNTATMQQLTDANQPQLVANQLNGGGVIDFDGVSERLGSTKASSYYNFLHNGVASSTIFFVIRVEGAANAQRILRTISAGTDIGFALTYFNTGSINLAIANGSLILNLARTSVPSGSYLYGAAGYNSGSGNYELFVNELATVSAAPSGAESASDATYTLDWAGKINLGAAFLQGQSSEIFLVTGSSPSDNRDYLTDWANSEWGL